MTVELEDDKGKKFSHTWKEAELDVDKKLKVRREKTGKEADV